jgi:nucleotide-binding universal stress UspA family protein
MIKLENILVPVDFSQPAIKALRYGMSLATQFRARLVLAHVVPSLAMFDYGLPERIQELEKLAFEDARKSLDQCIPQEYRNLVNIHPVIKGGDVREELLRIIHDEKIDLVVMGSHGRRNIERFFLGSTTEHMLRKVPVPILTVSRIIPGHEIHTPSPVPIRRIVYAVDLSENSEIGLRYSAELARTFGAELELVHAIDPLETGQWAIEVPGSLPFDLSAIQECARERLQQIVKGAEIEDLKVSISVVEGIPHNTIIRFADEVHADLIVQNLKSKGVLERVMLGATAERVIRASHIPVLSIPVGDVSSFMQATFERNAVSYRR